MRTWLALISIPLLTSCAGLHKTVETHTSFDAAWNILVREVNDSIYLPGWYYLDKEDGHIHISNTPPVSLQARGRRPLDSYAEKKLDTWNPDAEFSFADICGETGNTRWDRKKRNLPPNPDMGRYDLNIYLKETGTGSSLEVVFDCTKPNPQRGMPADPRNIHGTWIGFNDISCSCSPADTLRRFLARKIRESGRTSS